MMHAFIQRLVMLAVGRRVLDARDYGPKRHLQLETQCLVESIFTGEAELDWIEMLIMQVKRLLGGIAAGLAFSAARLVDDVNRSAG
jgi:hypothetical protein